MWFDGVNFGIIFITSIFLSYQGFVECDIDCHENDCPAISSVLIKEVTLYRVKHKAQALGSFHKPYCNVTVQQAKSLALSGKIKKNDLYINVEHRYSNIFGHIEGIPYENYGQNIAEDIVKRWYEEKNKYNGNSYSSEIANFTRMLWNESYSLTCAICSKDINTHYIVCAFRPYEPSNNHDPSAEQFKKNVFFINDDLITQKSTSEKTITKEHSRSTNQKHITYTPIRTTTTKYLSIHTNFEKETTIERPGSCTSYYHRSPTPCPLMKTLLAGIIYMTAVLGIIPIIILLIIIYQRRL